MVRQQCRGTIWKNPENKREKYWNRPKDNDPISRRLTDAKPGGGTKIWEGGGKSSLNGANKSGSGGQGLIEPRRLLGKGGELQGAGKKADLGGVKKGLVMKAGGFLCPPAGNVVIQESVGVKGSPRTKRQGGL